VFAEEKVPHSNRPIFDHPLNRLDLIPLIGCTLEFDPFLLLR
jgi:hypothetical protein